jgi:hypothetical protein
MLPGESIPLLVKDQHVSATSKEVLDIKKLNVRKGSNNKIRRKCLAKDMLMYFKCSCQTLQSLVCNSTGPPPLLPVFPSVTITCSHELF